MIFSAGLILVSAFYKTEISVDTKFCTWIWHTVYKFLYCVMDISFVFVTLVANSKHLWHYVVLYGLISVSYTGISIPCDLILYYVYAQIFWILIFVKPVANTNVHSQEICFSMFDFGECVFINFQYVGFLQVYGENLNRKFEDLMFQKFVNSCMNFAWLLQDQVKLFSKMMFR